MIYFIGLTPGWEKKRFTHGEINPLHLLREQNAKWTICRGGAGTTTQYVGNAIVSEYRHHLLFEGFFICTHIESDINQPSRFEHKSLPKISIHIDTRHLQSSFEFKF